MHRPISLTLPTIGAIAATRGMLGAGIGMLAASRMNPDHRRRVGRVLLAIGLLSTAPLIRKVVRSRRADDRLASGAEENHLVLDRRR